MFFSLQQKKEKKEKEKRRKEGRKEGGRKEGTEVSRDFTIFNITFIYIIY